MPTPTTRVQRCDCCDLLNESCGRAAEQRLRHEERRSNDELMATPGWFPARYPGTCARCGEYFAAGSPIRSNRGAKWTEPSYVGACCA